MKRDEKCGERRCALALLGDRRVGVRPSKTRRIAAILAVVGSFLAWGNGCSEFELRDKLPDSVSLASLDLRPTRDLPLSSLFRCEGPRQYGSAALRRLTKVEYVATLHDLLDVAFDVDSLSSSLALVPGDPIYEGFDNFLRTTTSAHVTGFDAVAEAIAQKLAQDPAALRRLPGASCWNDAPDESCVRGFLRTFGLRVYRRPLATEDVDFLFTELFSAPEASTPAEGLAMAIEFLFQSPDFLFRLENRGAEIEPNLLALTDYEIASRLSYLLIGSMPDMPLFQAAGRGELRAPDNVRAHVARLLATERGAKMFEKFVFQWLRMNAMPSFNPTVASRAGIDPTALKAEAKQEAADFIRYVAFATNGGYRDLLTSRTSFVSTDALAAAYGVPKSTRADRMTTLPDQRAGILTRAAFLAGSGLITSPISRGLTVRRFVLCDNVRDLSETNLSAEEIRVVPPDPGLTTRQRYERTTAPVRCMECHASFNPPGFALENFDPLGRHRSTETIYDSNSGAWLAEHSIDAAVRISIEGPVENVDGGAQLSQAIASGEKGEMCFVSQYFKFAEGRRASVADGCSMRALRSAVAGPSGGQGSLVEMIQAIASDEQFRRRRIDR